MPGKKTSVWLGEDEIAEWKASGASLTDIVKAGLAVMREPGGAPVPLDLGSGAVILVKALDAIMTDVQAIREDLARRPDSDKVRAIVQAELKNAVAAGG